jgi:hypothetical protein
MSTPAEIAMGEAAMKCAPELSEAEGAVCWPVYEEVTLTAEGVVLHEDWLYIHLVAATSADRAMDRMRTWGPEYHHEFTRRRHAIERASVHYHKLLNAKVELTPLLEQMARAAGLRP